jgi:beta-glucosidase
MNSHSFPADFLWGIGTSAHQVEGNTTNNEVWVLEHVTDQLFSEPAGDALDHFWRYPEDIRLLAELGMKSYRFSLEWSRIEPESGYYSQSAMDHYRRMVEVCHQNDVQPLISYHCFTHPRWMAADGGWENMENADRFARFCEFVTHNLKGMVPMGFTLNEANLPFDMQYRGLLKIGRELEHLPWFQEAGRQCGTDDPSRFRPFFSTEVEKGLPVCLAAHRKSVEAIKSIDPDVQLGITLSFKEERLAPGGEETRARFRAVCDDAFLDMVKDDDFVGVQTYTHSTFHADREDYLPQDVQTTQLGYPYSPASIGGSIRRVAEAVNCPIIVTENGIATDDDRQRIEFFQGALESVKKCVEDGIDVRGFLAWTLFDNFEWMKGYAPKFGLVAVDRSTQARMPKPSAHWFGACCQANAIQKIP